MVNSVIFFMGIKGGKMVKQIVTNNARIKSKMTTVQMRKAYYNLLAVNHQLNKEIKILQKTQHIKDNICKIYRHKIREFKIAKEELNAIIMINNACSASLDLKNICNLIAKFACRIMNIDACVIRILDRSAEMLLIEGERGLRKNNLNSRPLRIGESISGKAAKIARPLIVHDLNKENNNNCIEIISKDDLASIVAMPMIVKGRVLGVISVYSKKARQFRRSGDIIPLATFASQAAVAVQEAKLYDDIHKTYFNTMRSLVLAMEARDPYTRGHAERVTRYSMAIAKELGLPEHDLEILRYAGEVHDVGKIAISDLILNKPGKLTPAERVAIEAHPTRGAEMLEPLQFLKPAIPLVRHHHERYDGRGYPDGLVKEMIPLMARIMSCADAFDAMTSERPYRLCKMTIDKALANIEDNAGSQFDPKITKIFVKIIKRL